MSLSINDAINEYYKLKDTYETNYHNKYIKPIIKSKDKSYKEKRVQFSRLPKPECINCKRNVGSLFSIKQVSTEEELYRSFTIKCGDNKDPCPLNIDIKYSLRYPYQELLIDTQLKNTKNEIIKEKNNTIFGYISENEALEIFNKLTEKLKEESENYGFVLEKYILNNDNPVKYELINKKIDEFNKNNVMQFKKMIEEYKNTQGTQIVLDAVKYYIEEMVPQLKEIQQLKYEVNLVEYDETKGIYTLIQKKNSNQNLETSIIDVDKVVSFTKGLKQSKSKSKTIKKTTKSKTKTRKLPQTVQLEEEKEELELEEKEVEETDDL